MQHCKEAKYVEAALSLSPCESPNNVFRARKRAHTHTLTRAECVEQIGRRRRTLLLASPHTHTHTQSYNTHTHIEDVIANPREPRRSGGGRRRLYVALVFSINFMATPPKRSRSIALCSCKCTLCVHRSLVFPQEAREGHASGVLSAKETFNTPTPKCCRSVCVRTYTHKHTCYLLATE